MLPKYHRLPGFIIPQIIQKGKSVQSTLVSLRYVLTTPTAITRITIIVPTRLSKYAVARNRTKRLIAEAIHQHISALSPGYDVIIMAKKLLKTEKLQDVLPEIEQLLRKANLIEQLPNTKN